MAKVQLKPDADGNLLIPKSVLGDAPPDAVYTLEREGRTFRLEPGTRKLHEIEEPEERLEAFDAFLRHFAQPTGVRWPEDYDFRDDIYD